jgi:hypothetical protein
MSYIEEEEEEEEETYSHVSQNSEQMTLHCPRQMDGQLTAGK